MNNEEILIKLSEKVKLRGFSTNTLKHYMYNLSRFMIWYNKPIENTTKTEFEKYILELIKKEYQENTIRQILASLNFTFKYVLNKNTLSYEHFPRPKKKKTLPKVLNKEEIEKIIENIKNEKHQIMIEFLYSSGFRVSELINLKRENINLKNNTILIEQSKGKKDRLTILSKKIKEKLPNYLLKTQFSTKYLFETNRNQKYTKATIEAILKKASKSINKHVNPHMLRHSFATHLLQTGTDIRYIQKLLGHSKLETTAIYTQVTINSLENIKSPYDD